MTGDCHVQFGERLEGRFLWPTHLITSAASIYVGSTIGGAASTISSIAFAGAASLASGTAPLAFAIGSIGAVVSPVMFFAAPLLAFDAAYPGVIAEKAGAYFN